MHAPISCLAPVHALILTLLSASFDERNRVFFSSLALSRDCAVCMTKHRERKSAIFFLSGAADDPIDV